MRAPPETDARVRGLGACDALEVVLSPLQVPGLADEIEELRRAHLDGLVHAVRRDDDDVELHRAELDALAAISAQLPPDPVPSRADVRAEVRVLGPAETLSSLARGAALAAAEALAALLPDGPHSLGPAERERAVTLAAAAAAWTGTVVECAAVADYEAA